MNETNTNAREPEVPWHDRAMFSTVGNGKIVLATVAVLLCAFGTVFCSHEQVAFLLSFFLFGYVVLTVRAPGSVAVLLLTAFLSFFLTSGFFGSALVLSLIVGTGSLAWLLTVLQSYRRLLAVLPLCVVFVAAWIWTQRPEVALLSFAFLPSAVALAAATVTHQRRTTAICCATGGSLLTLIVGAVIWICHFEGTAVLSDLPSWFARLRTDLGTVLIASRDELFDRLTDTLSANGSAAEEITETIESLRQTFSDGTIRSAVSAWFALLPALAVTVCNVLSFEAQLFLNHSYWSCGWKQVLTFRATAFTMSVPAGVLYVIGFLATLFFDGSSLVGAALQNLCLILLPGCCVVGWGTVLSGLHRASTGKKVFVLLFLAALVCCSGVFSFYFLALWGAGTVLSMALHMHLSKNLPSDDDHEDHA